MGGCLVLWPMFTWVEGLLKEVKLILFYFWTFCSRLIFSNQIVLSRACQCWGDTAQPKTQVYHSHSGKIELWQPCNCSLAEHHHLTASCLDLQGHQPPWQPEIVDSELVLLMLLIEMSDLKF